MEPHARQSTRRLEEQRRVALQSAPLLRLQQGEEADVVERLDGLVGQPPQILRGLGAIPNLRQQIIDGSQDRLSITLLNGRHLLLPLRVANLEKD